MSVKHELVAKAEMRIHRPVAEVFEAFVDPALKSKFWFTKGSGRLEAGAQVRWDWETLGDTTTTVEWVFTPRADHTTFVSITNAGFGGDEDEIAQEAIDSTEGFALVLAGAKAYLEHNINLNLVADRHPDGLEEH